MTLVVVGKPLFLRDAPDMYGPFLNEELLAKAIAGRRDRIILATKFGVMHNLPQTRLCH
ncbi:MAG: hypothetical protein AAGE59_27085 [Cyanobacteria bacterium P01_F01_bin.86]